MQSRKAGYKQENHERFAVWNGQSICKSPLQDGAPQLRLLVYKPHEN